MAIELALHALEQISIDDRVVLAFVNLILVHDLSEIDPVAQQVWTYDRKKRVFWTSEDPQTVRAKMAYANELGLRGAMIWEISQDTSGWLLLDALLDGLDSGS